MLAISLMRMGAKKRPFYRVVVKEKRSKRDGKYLENLGTYDPLAEPADVRLNHERIQYWIGVGAQPTETVTSLIKHNPVQTEEERDAALAARAEKKATAETERLAAKKAEQEKIAAEEVEKAAARAEADAAAAARAAEAEAAAEAPVEEVAEASADGEAVEAAPAEEAAETTEAAPDEGTPVAEETLEAAPTEDAPAVAADVVAEAKPAAEEKSEDEAAA